MRIAQGYVSKSIMDFPFHQIYSLDDYNDSWEPSVFFGMYRYEDWCMVCHHHRESFIFWTGQDALDFQRWDEMRESMDATHLTAHPKIHELITSNGIECQLVRPSSFLNDINPKLPGEKIYAYVPSGMPEYHGIHLIQQLQEEGHHIIIGDGSYSQTEWRAGKADEFYDQCYMGLCLSPFAGGGTSIIEMGLRGMPVVTNVFNLSNCFQWKNIKDIREHISRFRDSHRVQEKMAKMVWHDLDHEFKWLEV